MKLNIGTTDQKIRLGLAIIIAAAALLADIHGSLLAVLAVAAGIMLLTSLVRFCPLYTACGITTKKES